MEGSNNITPPVAPTPALAENTPPKITVMPKAPVGNIPLVNIVTPAVPKSPTPKTSPINQIPPIAPTKPPVAPEEKFTSAPALKTFKSDVAETVQKDHVSIVKMALAESEKRDRSEERQEADSPLSKRNLGWIISSIVVLVIAAGALGYFYFKSIAPAPTVNTPPLQTDLIFSESTKIIPQNELSKKTLTAFIDAERTVQLPLGSILKIQLASSTEVTTSQFWAALFTRMPAELLRSFDNGFFLGVHAFSTNEPFLIVPVGNYETAYAGMLAWEKDIKDDIGALFSQATTSLPAFQDKVIENKDARILLDTDGKILFFYSFVDKKTLIFTTNSNTLKELLIRLNKPKLIH